MREVPTLRLDHLTPAQARANSSLWAAASGCDDGDLGSL
jgi:hypothetical protein